MFITEGNSTVLNKKYNPLEDDNSKIKMKDGKVKVFYFKANESDALITCFKENISKNKSEFRHMPEDEAVFTKEDYSKIYDLQNEETINKFRGVSGIEIDKFEFSKLLGKHLRISGLVNDKKENNFNSKITEILNSRVIIENYSVWEKIVEILIVNESWESLKDIIVKFSNAINSLNYEKEDLQKSIKNTLVLYLVSILNRSFALVWGNEVDKCIDDINELIRKVSNENNVIINKRKRKAYCYTRMIDKSIISIQVDMLNLEDIFSSDEILNLTNFKQMLSNCSAKISEIYAYYPYLLTMYDFSIMSCVKQLNNKSNSNLSDEFKEQVNLFIQSNYIKRDEHTSLEKILQVSEIDGGNDITKYLIKINNDKKNILKFAIANVCLNHSNFKKVVLEKPNRSYKRYKDLSKIINEAIDEQADILVMPESYVPFEWLPTVARTCSKNNLAIVTGVEHIKINNKIYNSTFPPIK